MTPLQLLAPINLQASAADKPRRFRILAYSGGKLSVDGFDLPVIVDLAGLEAKAVSVVLDHETTTAATVGQTDTITNNGRSLMLAGIVTGQSPRVQQVLAQADAGHQWQASIGASVELSERIPAGHTVAVNGQTFQGPVIVARKAVLRETSVLPVGADCTTTVNLAAKAATQEGKMTMQTFETWLASKGFDNTDNLSPESVAFLQSLFDSEDSTTTDSVPASATANFDLRAAHAADHRRISQINSLTVGRPEIGAVAIQAGWSPERTEIAVLKSQLRPTSPSNHQRTNGTPDSHQVLCASFAMNCGASPAFLAKSMGEAVIDAATSLEARGATLFTVMSHVLQAAGMSAPSHKITDSFIRAAFQASQKLEASGMSTVSLPGILSNSANKLLLEGYAMVKPTWQEFCAIGNLADLKEATRYRLTPTGDFEEIGPAGEIKHMALTTEDAYTIQGKTYARMVALTRTSIINDDLSAFEAIPKMLGRMAAIKLEKLIYTLLLGNSGSFFHANNHNYLSGGGSALSITALTAAEKLFLNQTDGNGDPVMITPEVLLVPTSLSVTANQLVRDLQVVAIGVGASAVVTPDGNPHAGRFKAVVSPWIENANLTGYSNAKWYLLARPQGSSGLIEVGFLDGQQTPTIENGELDFSQLGIALRGFHDIGVAFQDPKYGVLNAGA